MRKGFRKPIALLAAGVLTMGALAGCKGSSDETTKATDAATTAADITTAADTTSAEDTTAAGDTTAAEETDAETTEPAGEYTDYSAGFPERVTIQIPVYDRAYEGWDVTNNRYTQWVQESFGDKYNVEVEFVAINRTEEIADYTQRLSAGTAPDIIMHYDMPQAINYYSEGVMQELDLNEVAYYAPTYYENLADTIDTYGQMDGKNYFLFAERPTYYYNWVTLIRQDWLDQVGAEMPQNVEELNEVGLKWKEAGLGTLDHQLLNRSFTYYYGFIGTEVDEKEVALYADLNVSPLTWAPAKAYLQNLNHQYNEGILNPEFYLVKDDATAMADFVSGKAGMYAFYISSQSTVISSLLANDPDAKVSVIPATTKNPEGNNPYFYEYPPYGMIMGINTDTTDEERAAVYMYLDWLSQPENLFQFENGVEGENYTLDESGLAVQNADYTGEWKRSNNNNKDYWCLVVEAAVYDDPELTELSRLKELAPAGYEYLVEDSKAYNAVTLDYGLISTAYTKPVVSLSENSADLNELWQELYIDITMCSEADFETVYADACQTYLDAGYQEILDEKAALYDAGDYK